MPSWHQMNAFRRDGFPKLSHPTLWTSYNPQGHLSVMRHESHEACIEYCKRTGNVPLPPDNLTPKEKQYGQTDHHHQQRAAQTAAVL